MLKYQISYWKKILALSIFDFAFSVIKLFDWFYQVTSLSVIKIQKDGWLWRMLTQLIKAEPYLTQYQQKSMGTGKLYIKDVMATIASS